MININGELFSEDQAKISVFDRGFLFGDSVYDVTITYNGKPFLIDEHLQRLQHSAEMVAMQASYSIEDLKSEIKKTIDASNIQEGNLRLILTRGQGELTLDPTGFMQNNLVIIYRSRQDIPEHYYNDGVPIIIADIQRVSKKSVDPNIKSGNYLNNLLALAQAKKANAYEAVMLNQAGYVTEATTSNIWIVKDGIVKTPPLQAGLLEGITRTQILKLAQQANIKIQQKNLSPEELKHADECFLTSTSRMVLPVNQVDEFPISNGNIGPITLKLLNLYRDFVTNWAKETSW